MGKRESQQDQKLFQFPKLGLMIHEPGKKDRLVEFDDPRTRFVQQFLTGAPAGVEISAVVTYPEAVVGVTPVPLAGPFAVLRDGENYPNSLAISQASRNRRSE